MAQPTHWGAASLDLARRRTNLIPVDTTLAPARSWVLANLARWPVVALLGAPVFAVIDLAARSEADLQVGELVSWTILAAPYLLFLGAGGAAVFLAALWFLNARRAGSVVLAAALGTAVWATLIAAPRGLSLDDVVVRSAMASLPIWIAYGAVVRLPAR